MIYHNHDVKLAWVANQLHGAVVNNYRFELNFRIESGNLRDKTYVWNFFLINYYRIIISYKFVLFLVPPNGLVIYCGTIVTEEGKEKKVT